MTEISKIAALAALALAGGCTLAAGTAPDRPAAASTAADYREALADAEAAEAEAPALSPEAERETLLFGPESFDFDPNAVGPDGAPREDFSPESPEVSEVYPASAPADSDQIVSLIGSGLSPFSTIIFKHLASGRRGFLPYAAADSRGYPLRDSADAPAILEFFVSPALYLPPGTYEIVVLNPLGAESAPVRFDVTAAAETL